MIDDGRPVFRLTFLPFTFLLLPSLCVRGFGDDALPLFVERAKALVRPGVLFVEAREQRVVARRVGRGEFFRERGESLLRFGHVRLDRLRVALAPLLLRLLLTAAAPRLRLGARRSDA